MSEKREHELALFKRFLELAPEFCGEELAEWHQPEEKDFPDIKAKSASGRTVGVEIGEWLNEDEMQAAKRKERTEAEFLATIGDQGINPTQHVRYVWLHPKPKGRIAPADAQAFRDQLFGFVLECDHRWPKEKFWGVGPVFGTAELAAYPMLARHLRGIKLWPSREEGVWKQNWITFPAGGGFFSQETMLGPLRELVGAKVAHYGAKSGFDDLSLLVIYNRACMYNSPAETPLHSYDDAVAELKGLFDRNRGAFNRVFLYIAVEPGSRVVKVW